MKTREDGITPRPKREARSQFIGMACTTKVSEGLEGEALAMGVKPGQVWAHPDDGDDPPITIRHIGHRYIVHKMHPGAQTEAERARQNIVQAGAPYAVYGHRGLLFSISCAELVSTRSKWRLKAMA